MSLLMSMLVKIGVDTAALKIGLEDTEKMTGDATKKMGISLGKVGEIAAGMLTSEAFKRGLQELESAAMAMVNWGNSIDTLGDMFGMSGEKASAWSVAMQHVGLSVAEGGQQLNYFTRMLADNNENLVGALDKLGVSALDSSGQLRSFDDLMPSIMDAFQKLPAGIEASSVAMDLFGARGGSKFLDFLRQGSTGLDTAAEKARAFGLSMDTITSDRVEQLGFKTNDLGMRFEGIKVNIGLGLIDPLTEAIRQIEVAMVAAGQLGAILSEGAGLHQTGGSMQWNPATRKTEWVADAPTAQSMSAHKEWTAALDTVAQSTLTAGSTIAENWVLLDDAFRSAGGGFVGAIDSLAASVYNAKIALTGGVERPDVTGNWITDEENTAAYLLKLEALNKEKDAARATQDWYSRKAAGSNFITGGNYPAGATPGAAMSALGGGASSINDLMALAFGGNLGAAQGWMGAFQGAHGREAGVTDVRDMMAGNAFAARTGRAATDEEWKERYYKGGFEGEDKTGLDAIFGPAGTLSTQMAKKAAADAADYKLMLEAFAAQKTATDTGNTTLVDILEKVTPAGSGDADAAAAGGYAGRGYRDNR